MPFANPPITTHSWLAPFYAWLKSFVAYVNNAVGGSGWAAVRVMTAAALPANTYVAGTQTKTATANGLLNDTGIDGVTTLTIGDRVWDKDAVTGSNRGLFTITGLGGASAKWTMKRATDASTSADFIDGKSVEVGSEGTANGGERFLLTNATFTLDTDTPAIARETGVVHVDDAQTITGVKKFAQLSLAVWNAAKTFAASFTWTGTAAHTVTIPDTDLTIAQAGVASGSTTPGTGGGTAPAFTGTAPLAAVDVTPAFAGTGLTAAEQVLTTTDNQTMTLNQCAGMLLVSIGGNACVILSNTAVVGAPAVFTVAGKATTDAGVYSVFTGLAPVGTVASHTHTGAAHTHVQT